MEDEEDEEKKKNESVKVCVEVMAVSVVRGEEKKL